DVRSRDTLVQTFDVPISSENWQTSAMRCTEGKLLADHRLLFRSRQVTPHSGHTTRDGELNRFPYQTPEQPKPNCNGRGRLSAVGGWPTIPFPRKSSNIAETE